MSVCGYEREAWSALDNLSRPGKSFNAGDACLCCHEFEKTSYMAMEGNSRLFIFFTSRLLFSSK
jgi:hypothetical protein